jgi:hypothetical protein
MFAAVGYGSISVNQILFKLIDFYRKETPQVFEVRAGHVGRNPGGVLVNGQSGILVHFAGCCSPVPGDAIISYTSRGRGTVIHRADCSNLRGVDQHRLLPAEWQLAAGDKQRYNANISIRAIDQGAALSVLSSVVSELKMSISAVNGRILDSHTASAIISDDGASKTCARLRYCTIGNTNRTSPARDITIYCIVCDCAQCSVAILVIRSLARKGSPVHRNAAIRTIDSVISCSDISIISGRICNCAGTVDADII